MTVFWNKVMRWITNCFSSTPVPILAYEASLPPLFSLLPDLPPPIVPRTKPYSSLKREFRVLLMDHWTLQAMPPLYYLYKSTMVPHAFMGLDRFSVGWVYQMRAGKSYLVAHPS